MYNILHKYLRQNYSCVQYETKTGEYKNKHSTQYPEILSTFKYR